MRDLLAFGQSQRQQRPNPLLRTMVGGVLRRTRLSQGRTLADVAASARISMQYLSELERGRKEASSEILAALCRALRLDLSELLAAVGHDLLNQRDHRAGVVRIGAFRDDAAQPARPEPAPDLAATPADGGLAGAEAAPGAVAGDLLARQLLAGGQLADGDLSSPAGGATDLVCRLAA